MAGALKVCAWCRKTLGTSEEEFRGSFPVTHGICPECSARLLESVSLSAVREFLESLGAPVLLVDDDVRVLVANTAACDLLGRERSEVERLKGGDVIQCVHADLPGGCGQSVHCRSCTIRNSVRKTFETGLPVRRAPAYPDVYLRDGVKTLSLRVSTERVGGAILLRIEEGAPRPHPAPKA
ncbi:MAG: PAS domain-containing protein [Elusimicrobia bacterium]|nr:PAS domain-containing protein [Elusimicrobiota bacterium]